MTPDTQDFIEILKSHKSIMATQHESINKLNERDLQIVAQIGDLVTVAESQKNRVTEQNRDMMTLRERVESIAAEVQRMKDKDFPPTMYSDKSMDDLLRMIGNGSIGHGEHPNRTYEQIDIEQLRAEVRRRLNQ